MFNWLRLLLPPLAAFATHSSDEGCFGLGGDPGTDPAVPAVPAAATAAADEIGTWLDDPLDDGPRRPSSLPLALPTGEESASTVVRHSGV